MKARRQMHSLEISERSEGRRAKEHVEFKPGREQARHKTRDVQEHLGHVRHKSTFGTRYLRQKARKTQDT